MCFYCSSYLVLLNCIREPSIFDFRQRVVERPQMRRRWRRPQLQSDCTSGPRKHRREARCFRLEPRRRYRPCSAGGCGRWGLRSSGARSGGRCRATAAAAGSSAAACRLQCGGVALCHRLSHRQQGRRHRRVVVSAQPLRQPPTNVGLTCVCMFWNAYIVEIGSWCHFQHHKQKLCAKDTKVSARTRIDTTMICSFC